MFRPNERDFKLLVEWWYQMEWVNNIKDYDYQEEILKNNIRNLLVATDIEIMDHVGDSLRNSRGHAWMLVNRFSDCSPPIAERHGKCSFMLTSFR